MPLEIILNFRFNYKLFDRLSKLDSVQLFKDIENWIKNEDLFKIDIPVIFLWNINESYLNKKDKTLKYMFQVDNQNYEEWVKQILSNNLSVQWFYNKFMLTNFIKWYNLLHFRLKKYTRESCCKFCKWWWCCSYDEWYV